MKGKIITIEGQDGSGKKTQTELLIQRARDAGYKVETISFPQYNRFWGRLIRFYLDGGCGNLKSINPKDASVLYAYDRKSALPMIAKLLNNGVNLILDRYMESNWAHQGGKLKGEGREEMIRWLYDFEIRQLKLPESDLVLYLDLPVEHSINAIKDRKKDMHELDRGYLENVRETYLYLAETRTNWVIINCVGKNNKRLTPEQVSDAVWNAVKDVLRR